MNIASIDIGTNTVLMLIASIDITQKELNPLYNKYEIPRIGKGLALSGYIPDDKIELLRQILSGYAAEAGKYGCTEIIASGTYPFRTAINGSDVIDLIANSTGITISALSGDKEANFSFLGAISDIPSKDNVCVIDIGGGSTELILGNKSEITIKISAPIGVVNLTEELIKHYPVSGLNLKEIRDKIQNMIINFYPHNIKASKAIAIAGTPTTLACIKLGLSSFNEEKIHKAELSINDIELFIESLALLNAEEVKEKYSTIVKGREDVLLTGSIILAEIMSFLNFDKVIVSTRGLRYGAIIEKYF